MPGKTLNSRPLRSANKTLLFMPGTDDEAETLDGKVKTAIERVFPFLWEKLSC